MEASQAQQAQMAWIRARVDPDAPDDTHIVLGIDISGQAGSGERDVSRLLESGMESEEGVFYLLPQDLCYEATSSGGIVTVDLLTLQDVWVKVLTATIPFPEGAEIPEGPIVLIDHEGIVGLDELLETIAEAGMCIVGPKPVTESE